MHTNCTRNQSIDWRLDIKNLRGLISKVFTSCSRFILHPLHWTFGNGQISHSKLRESVSNLDNDLERYEQIFVEETKGANIPLNISSCLSSQEAIIGASDSVEAGIAPEVAAASIPEGAINWWINFE